MRRLILALTCATTLAAAPAALARTTSAGARGVTATLSYSTGPDMLPVARTLTIARHRHVVYRRAVSAPQCGHQCSIATGPSGRSPVHVLDLTGDGTADVVVDLYTGGAHCCTVEQVLTPSATDPTRWRRHQRDFGDPGARLERRPGGGAVFVSADDRFADAFTDFAASGLPLQILRFDGDRFVDVTGDFRSRVVADATRWLDLYYRQAAATPPWGDSVGLIAAWAADEYRLGRAGFARRLLDREARAGHLRSALPGAEGRRFVATLEAMLRRTGYDARR